MSKHPIAAGRRAALYDPAFWVPMKGIVSKIASEFALPAETAGQLISDRMEAGEIGHMAEGSWIGSGWIVNPRGAELAKRAGLDYETMLNWHTGALMAADGSASWPILIFWPDVERAVRSQQPRPAIRGVIEHPPKAVTRAKPTQVEVDVWIANYFRAAWEAGRPPPKRDLEAFPDCKAATGAVDAQMKKAMAKVSENHKRGRGNRDRQIG